MAEETRAREGGALILGVAAWCGAVRWGVVGCCYHYIPQISPFASSREGAACPGRKSLDSWKVCNCLSCRDVRQNMPKYFNYVSLH